MVSRWCPGGVPVVSRWCPGRWFFRVGPVMICCCPDSPSAPSSFLWRCPGGVPADSVVARCSGVPVVSAVVSQLCFWLRFHGVAVVSRWRSTCVFDGVPVVFTGFPGCVWRCFRGVSVMSHSVPVDVSRAAEISLQEERIGPEPQFCF